MRFARLGVFPEKDHLGNPFPERSWRKRMAGKALAGLSPRTGFKLGFVQFRSDNDFAAFCYG
eukprot:2327897-Alexandrium_andersonii.AAC.1